MKPHKKFIKITAIILIVCTFVFVFSSCKEDTQNTDTSTQTTAPEQTNTEKKNLTLPYAKADALDPYKAESLINQSLMTLVYDSLFRIDATFTAIPVIAVSGEVNKNEVIVQLNTNIKFSDGTALTAKDVVYSFQQAKNSPAYIQRLKNIASASEQGSSTVVFRLSSPDLYALNGLDFAIVKNESVQKLAYGTEPSSIASPIGSGRYVFKEQSGKTALVENKNSIASAKIKNKTILLLDVPDTDALAYSLQIENIDFIFQNLSNGVYQRINAVTHEVSLNNLVYLGFNARGRYLHNAQLRKAISLALNRERIVTTSYQGHAKAALTPFNPNWAEIKDIKTVQKITADRENAVKLLEETKSGDSLTLNLIVNSENPFRLEAAYMIAAQLSDIGITVNVKPLAWDAYTAALKNGNFDLYLSEIKLNRTMNLSSILSTVGNASYGILTSNPAISAYSQLLDGTITIQAFLDIFDTEMPFTPVCYRNGIAAYSRKIASEVVSCEGDLYYNINEWDFK